MSKVNFVKNCYWNAMKKFPHTKTKNVVATDVSVIVNNLDERKHNGVDTFFHTRNYYTLPGSPLRRMGVEYVESEAVGKEKCKFTYAHVVDDNGAYVIFDNIPDFRAWIKQKKNSLQ